MEIAAYNKIYFLGIGGIGMSALARWFAQAKYEVAGYDRTPSEITNKLIADGVEVTFDDHVESIPQKFRTKTDETLIVYTPAIPGTHEGFQFFKQKGYKILKRSQALGLLAKDRNSIAVAGTHGKTSISSTTAWLLNNSCNAFLGGISKNINSNIIINPHSENFVIEADEFDRSFLTLYPNLAVISAIDADHLDIYENKEDIVDTFNQFVKQIKKGGILVYKNSLDINKEINTNITYYTYSLDHDADFYALNISIVDGYYKFDLKTPTGIIEGFRLGVPGLYNLENAIAALALAIFSGVLPGELKEKLDQYEGVKRRFDYQIRDENLIYIDDYAHHPEEIRACINSIRDLYPDKRIAGIFQPHLYTRTRDFAKEFAASLDLCDEVVLTNIYPAREEPINGVSSELIYNSMTLAKKSLVNYEEVLNKVKNIDSEVIVTMGAGDIDRLVEPISNKLREKHSL